MGWSQSLLAVLLVALAYAVSGKLGLLLAIPPGYATAVWPPSGVALAAGLLCGYRIWPGILVGSFLVNVSTSWDASTLTAALRSLALALAIASGAATQAMVGTWLIRRWVGFRNMFTHEADVFRILVLGGPVSCLVNATIGVGSLWAAGLIPDANVLFNVWTWWIGDSIGVLIFTPLICAWSLRPREQWLRKQISLSVPMGIVFVAVVALYFYVSHEEQRRIAAEFEDRAVEYGNRLQKAVDANMQLLTVLDGFYGASDHVSEEQFNRFVTRILPAHPAVQVVGWAPRIEAQNLATFEATMRSEGLENYRVFDRGSDGRVLPAQDRAVYFPVAYIVPLAGNQGVPGYDVTSEPVRRDAVLRALKSGRAAATTRIHLVQDPAARPSVIIYLPIYGKRSGDSDLDHPLGIASAVIRLDDLASASIQGLAGLGLQARILDGPGASENETLLAIGSAQAIRKANIAQTLSIPIRVADHRWTAQFILPADYLVAHRSWQAWGLLAVGLSLTALLEMLLLVLLARQSRVEELVTLRTAELLDAEQRFRGLLEAAPDAMIMIDDKGAIELVNLQAERLFGYPRAELVGQSIDILVPLPLRERHAVHRAKFFEEPRTREMGAGLDLSARRKDHSEFPVEVSLGQIGIGARRFAIAAVRDVSERASVQRKLATYAADLERSNRELEQFAYVASHDLQAPLRGILSFAELLRRRFLGKVLEGKGEEFLQHIEQSGRHMEALIRDLLAFSRVGRHDDRREAVNCEEVLAEVLILLDGIVRERGATIDHEPLPVVFGTRLEILLLFQNLIANGLKFQPGEQPRVRIFATRDGAMWRLSVQDFGIGIEPRDQERIFRVFQRLHGSSAYEGTGIGLAICQKIVASHGGRIWVESAAGQGATFHFTLPAAGAPA